MSDRTRSYVQLEEVAVSFSDDNPDTDPLAPDFDEMNEESSCNAFAMGKISRRTRKMYDTGPRVMTNQQIYDAARGIMPAMNSLSQAPR